MRRREGATATAVSIDSPQRARIPVLICLVLGLLGTLPLVVLTPPFQVPDEMQHFDRAYQVSEGGFLAEVKDGVVGGMLPSSLDVLTRRFLGTDAILAASRAVRPEPFARTVAAHKIPLEPRKREFISFTGAAAYPPQAYLPQVVGIMIGRLFGAGPLVLLFLARLANALTAVTLLSFAIGLMPIGRPLALFGGLLPMALYEYASASADATVISGVFLITALQLRALAQGRWRPREVAVSAAIGLIICSTKPVYAPLLLIAGPATLVRGQRMNQLVSLVTILLVAVGGAVFWFAVNSGRLIVVRHGADIHAQAHFVLTHPLAFVAAMATSLRVLYPWYTVTLVGRLGWLNVSLPHFAYGLALVGFVPAWLAAGRERARISAGIVLWWLVLFAGAVTLTMLAMYIDWTPVGAQVVAGVQGRYFIPLLALFAAIAAALPMPKFGRRAYALLFSAASGIVLVNILVMIIRVCDAFSVLR